MKNINAMKTIRDILSVALREIMERKMVFAVAIVLGMVPFLWLLFATDAIGPKIIERNDVGLIGAIATFCFSTVFAVIIGASVIGRDMVERRLSFLFVRPISAFSIWAGKIAGGMALLYASSALVLLPSVLAFGRAGSPLAREASGILEFFIFTMFLMMVGSVLGVIFRSKSTWLALDLVAAPVSMILIVLAAGELFLLFFNTYRGWAPPKPFVEVLVVFVTVTLMIASAASVIFGRTDIKRAHRATSLSLWGMTLLGVLTFGGYCQWVVSASPEDLVSFYGGINAAPNSDWVAFGGDAQRRAIHPSFLVNTKTGKYHRLSVYPAFDVAYSNNGKWAGWLAMSGFVKPRAEVVLLELDRPDAEPIKTGITFADGVGLAFSDDGTRLVTVGDKLITVFELPSRKEINSVFVGENGFYTRKIYFQDADHMRVYRTKNELNVNVADNRTHMEILEIDLSTKKTEVVGKLTVPYGFLNTSFNGERIISFNNSTVNGHVTLYNGRTGEKIADLGTSKDAGTAKFLSDGRIIHTTMGTANNLLRVLSDSGVEERAIDFGADIITLGGEVAPGQLIVSLAKDRESRNARIALVDLATGKYEIKTEGFAPIYDFAAAYGQGSVKRTPGSEATKLFQAPDGSIIRYDALTGERRVIEAAGTDN